MTFIDFIKALSMGAVEAVTEFLPVSSTGHLILTERLIGFTPLPGHVFEVAIQLGAVLAVLVLYFRRLTGVVLNMNKDLGARHFVIVSLIAFFPAIIAGALFAGFIKAVLFNPFVVCVALIVGGVIIILVERKKREPHILAIETMPYKTALIIGLVQCLALIPGVSRSGATIIGALSVGVDRKSAAEFSFFQAIPLIAAATVYDLWKNCDAMTVSGMSLLAVGFITSFVGALIVIKWMLNYVTRHGFTVFGWYRIVAGLIGLILLFLIPA